MHHIKADLPNHPFPADPSSSPCCFVVGDDDGGGGGHEMITKW